MFLLSSDVVNAKIKAKAPTLNVKARGAYLLLFFATQDIARILRKVKDKFLAVSPNIVDKGFS